MSTVFNEEKFIPSRLSNLSLWVDAADSSTIQTQGSNVVQWNDKSSNANNLITNSFNPALSISGCVLWLDGKDPIGTGVTPANNTSISIWNDKSTNNNNGIQTTTANQPYYSNSSIVFSGSQPLSLAKPEILPGGSTPNGTYFFVLTSLVNTVLNPIFLKYGNNPATARTVPQFYSENSSGNYIIDVYGAPQNATSTFNDINNQVLLSSTIANSGGNGSITLYRNGATGIVSPNYTTTAINSQIGTIGQSFKGYINEIIVYNGILTQTQREQVEGYLAWKWGLQGNLPRQHPYRTVPVSFSSGSQLFLPTNIPACKLWLDANDQTTLTFNAGVITSWKDKSGNNYSAVPSTNNAGLTPSTFNNKNTIFLGSNQLNINSFDGSTDITTFFVLRGKTTGQTLIYDWSPQVGKFYYICFNNAALFNINNNYAVSDSLIPKDGTSSVTGKDWIIVCLGYTTGSLINYTLNGYVRTITSFSIINPNQTIQGTATLKINSGTRDSIDIAEIIHYNATLTTDQRRQVEGYLATKWGLQVNLPPNHPYYSLPIYQLIYNQSTLPNRQLWLDAADSNTYALVGTNITQWKDKSGNANHVNSIGTANYVTYTKTNKSVTFASGGILQTQNYINITSRLTIFIVSQITSLPTSLPILLDFPDIQGIGGYTIRYANISALNNANSADIGYGVGYYVNGDLLNQAAPGILSGFNIIDTYETNTTGNSRISFSSSFLSRYFIGNIQEVIVYNNVTLTDNQRQQVEGYLAWKWGLQGNLVNGHPYKTNPVSPPLIPTSITGCALWLDAADFTTIITNDSTSIAQWVDKSGINSPAIPVRNDGLITTSVLNELNVMNFGLNSMTLPNLVWSSVFTIFVVAKSISGKIIIDTLNSSRQYGNYVYTGNGNLMNLNKESNPYTILTAVNDSVIENGKTVVTTNQWNIFSIGYSGTGNLATNYAVNGTERSTITYGGNWPGGNYTNRPLSLYLNAVGTDTALDTTQFGEIMLYNTSITKDQRQQIEGYLAWKWGLVSNLPQDHPYKTYTVYTSTYPSITYNILNQPSIFFPNGAQMNSISNSGFGPINFFPNKIPGCLIWLDGNDINGNGSSTAIGTTVSTWKDKSGNRNDFTTYNTSPTYSSANSFNFVNFSNQINGLKSTQNVTTGNYTFTSFAIFYLPNIYGRFLTLTGTPGIAGQSWGFDYVKPSIAYIKSPYLWADSNDVFTSITTGLAGINSLFAYYDSNIHTAGGSYNFTNILNSKSAITLNIQASPLYIGGNPSNTISINSGLCELLLFNSILTLTQKQQIEGYLAWKWGLVGNLPQDHPYKTYSPNSFYTIPKTMIMAYQTSSTMRFSVGNDVSGGAFGLAQSNGTIYAPYQYAYGDTTWNVNQNTYINPRVVIATYDNSANIITGSYDFNANSDQRVTALISTISSDTPYILGTSTNPTSMFGSSNFYVNEIITYNRAITVTERKTIEGYLAWKWNLNKFLPVGHPYSNYPPSGEQVVDLSTAPNIVQQQNAMALWLDMADSRQYTLNGSNITTIKDKVTNRNINIGGNTSVLNISSIGSLPSINFPGNNTGRVDSTTGPFLQGSPFFTQQGSLITVFTPANQLTQDRLSIFSFYPGTDASGLGLGFISPTYTTSTLKSFTPSTNISFGPTLNLTANSPCIIYWAWYGGNAIYLSCNGTTLLSNIRGADLYQYTSANYNFYIGNDFGYGANFNLGEICMYYNYLETPFRQIMEGYLAWKWNIQSNLPTTHPYYSSAPSLQSLTDVNAISYPRNIPDLTLWLDAADNNTISIAGLSNVIRWSDKSSSGNNLGIGNSPVPPVISNFGVAPRPSIYFPPTSSLTSLYNSGADQFQFSAFLVASVANGSSLFIGTGGITTSTTSADGNGGKTFGFYVKNSSSAVYSPYVYQGTGAANLTVGNYSTISGQIFELYANVNGQTLNGNMNFDSTLSTNTNSSISITATPWVLGDCAKDTVSKSFHVHEMLTYSRTLTDSERQAIEGYLYWKWLI